MCKVFSRISKIYPYYNSVPVEEESKSPERFGQNFIRISIESIKLADCLTIVSNHGNLVLQVILGNDISETNNVLLEAAQHHPNHTVREAFNTFLYQHLPAKENAYSHLVKAIDGYTKLNMESFDSAYLVLYRLFSCVPQALDFLNNNVLPGLISNLTIDTNIPAFIKLMQLPNQHLNIIEIVQKYNDTNALVRVIDTIIEVHIDTIDQVAYENICLIKYYLTLTDKLNEIANESNKKLFLLDTHLEGFKKSQRGLTIPKVGLLIIRNKSSDLFAEVAAGTQYTVLNTAFMNPQGGFCIYVQIVCSLFCGKLINKISANSPLSLQCFNSLNEIITKEVEKSQVDINNGLIKGTVKSFKAEFKQILSRIIPIIQGHINRNREDILSKVTLFPDPDSKTIAEIFDIQISTAVSKLNELIGYVICCKVNPQDLHIKLELNGKKVRGNLLFWLDYVNQYWSNKNGKIEIENKICHIYGIPPHYDQYDLELLALKFIDQIHINIKHRDRYDTTTMFHKLLMLCKIVTPTLKQRIFFYYKAILCNLKIAPRNSFVYSTVNFFLFAGFASGDNFADSLASVGDISFFALITQILPAVVLAGEKLSAKVLKPILDEAFIQRNVTQQTINEIVKKIEDFLLDASVNNSLDGRLKNVCYEKKGYSNEDILTNLIPKSDFNIGNDEYKKIVRQHIKDNFDVCYELIPLQYWQIILTKQMENLTLFEKLLIMRIRVKQFIKNSINYNALN